MEITQIINLLKEKFPGGFDVAKVTDFIKGFDYKSLPIEEIITKVTASGLLNKGLADNIKQAGVNALGKKLGDIFGK